jgi:hypothetical protein
MQRRYLIGCSSVRRITMASAFCLRDEASHGNRFESDRASNASMGFFDVAVRADLDKPHFFIRSGSSSAQQK